MRNITGFLAGLIFGIGLIISGMANPAKVLNFLDILGPWDPSLAFVMGGAPLLEAKFDMPENNAIDAPLITGSILFGAGWGLGGFCPGPAWTSLAIGSPGILVFLPLMLVGIVLGTAAKSHSLFQLKGV